MGKKKNIKSISVKAKANNAETEAIDILKTTLEKQLKNSIENIDYRISMLSDEIVNLTNKIDILEKKNNPLSESFEGHLNNVSFKVPEITIDGKTFDISVDDFDDEDESENDNLENDNVNHPSHYTDGKYEVIQFVHDYMLWFDDGNAVKYICRAGKKNEDTYLEDLKKAEWYLYSWYEFTMEINDYRAFCEYRFKKLKKDRINVADFCRDKKLGFDLTKVINFIVLGRPYDAYLCLHSYVGYLEELGHEA